MKKVFRIIFVVFAMTMFSLASFAQQKPSERSFSSVMNEVRQKQAARSKLLQQIKQTTPPNAATQNRNVSPQPVNTNTVQEGPTKQSTHLEGTNTQPINTRPAVRQTRFSAAKKQ